MKKFFTFLLVLTCSYMSFAQFSEDFEGDLTSWTLDAAWAQGNSDELSSLDFEIPGTSKFICVNDDGAGQGVNLSGMAITPSFTVPNSADATLIFDYFFVNGDWQGADETAKVFITVDGGSNYTELVDLGSVTALEFQAYSMSLADYADQEVSLAFEYQDGQGWNFGFCVDNVNVFCTAC